MKEFDKEIIAWQKTLKSPTFIARELGIPRSTVESAFRRLNLPMPGRPLIPPMEEQSLRKLFEENYGNIAGVSRVTGIPRTTLHGWYERWGLHGAGENVLYKPKYPLELEASIDNGYVISFSDAHFWPLPKTLAHNALLEAIKVKKPSLVVANGDILDGARISRHPRMGWDEIPTLSDELNTCREFMAEIAKAAGKARLIFTLGNHDVRMEKYIVTNAQELEGVPGVTLEEHFPGWEVCWSILVNKKLMYKHRFKGGVYAPKNNALYAGVSMVTGHLHRQCVSAVSDYNGTRWGVDSGMLAEPKGPQFLYIENAPPDWRSGFAGFEIKNGTLLPPDLATVVGDGVYMTSSQRVI